MDNGIKNIVKVIQFGAIGSFNLFFFKRFGENCLNRKLHTVFYELGNKNWKYLFKTKTVHSISGEISFFRIGCTPKEIVEAHFEAAKAEMKNKSASVDLDGRENFILYWIGCEK